MAVTAINKAMGKFLNIHMIIFSTVLLTACSGTTADRKTATSASDNSDTPAIWQNITTSDSSEAADTTDYDNATFFVVIADSSLDYWILRKKMSDLNREFKIPIDTLGRLYNKTKNLIALPDDDEDELYAGEYFPRRFPSENLSLEYLKIYKQDASENAIALVTGIYQSENSADSALTVLKDAEKKIFKVKADIFVGCMH
jgi:hypothetical protein